jgi:hypothetical protein
MNVFGTEEGKEVSETVRSFWEREQWWLLGHKHRLLDFPASLGSVPDQHWPVARILTKLASQASHRAEP